jgi:hypothetical protein
MAERYSQDRDWPYRSATDSRVAAPSITREAIIYDYRQHASDDESEYPFDWSLARRFSVHVSTSDDIASWDWAVLRSEQAWKAHGKAVEDTGPFLPGSFDCKPRNIAEKINLGYKTREFQLYMFGLGPALLYGVLPERYWVNYCKLVRGIQISSQHRITNTDILSVHVLLCNWETEFKEIYYQLREDHLHFMRPCVH